MANENRYYKTPFAESGNKSEVPDVSVGGAVGYDTGFGPDYELPQGQPDRKRIERDMYNGVLNGVTGNLKQWQEGLYPTWIEDNGTGVAFSYPEGMVVSHAAQNWRSVEPSNQEEPGNGDKWIVEVSDINDLKLPLILNTVTEYKAFTTALPVGKVVNLLDRNADFTVIAGTGTADNFSVIASNQVSQSIVFINKGSVSPKQMGAGRDNEDYSAQIQACFDYAETNDIYATGDGGYYTKFTTTLKSNFYSFSGMQILNTNDFADGIANDIEELGRRIVIIDKINAKVENLLAVNTGQLANIVGLDYAQHQIKSTNSGAANCKVNTLIRSFSIVVKDGRNTNGGKATAETGVGYNLLAYAPFTNKEINALTIDGGEYFGSDSIAIDIGDTLNLFTTTIPAGEFHGTGLRIINQPTCDQGQILVDKMLNCFIDVYSEKSTAVLVEDAALVLGGAFINSLRGVEIIGYAANFAYFAKCLGPVSGIDMHNTRCKTVTTSALYLTSDQFTYKYHSNESSGSFTLGQEVHTGIRSGITGNAWLGKTIDVYDLYDGRQSFNGEHIYPNKTVNDGIQYEYNHARYRYYLTPFSAACTVAGNVVTFDTASEVANYNGGDAVDFTGTGGALTYVLAVDYEAGTMSLDSFAFSGAGNIEQQTQVPRVEFSTFQIPTLTGVKSSSVAWNTYTVDTLTLMWNLKTGVWTSHAL